MTNAQIRKWLEEHDRFVAQEHPNLRLGRVRLILKELLELREKLGIDAPPKPDKVTK